MNEGTIVPPTVSPFCPGSIVQHLASGKRAVVIKACVFCTEHTGMHIFVCASGRVPSCVMAFTGELVVSFDFNEQATIDAHTVALVKEAP